MPAHSTWYLTPTLQVYSLPQQVGSYRLYSLIRFTGAIRGVVGFSHTITYL